MIYVMNYFTWNNYIWASVVYWYLLVSWHGSSDTTSYGNSFKDALLKFQQWWLFLYIANSTSSPSRDEKSVNALIIIWIWLRDGGNPYLNSCIRLLRWKNYETVKGYGKNLLPNLQREFKLQFFSIDLFCKICENCDYAMLLLFSGCVCCEIT